MSRTCPRCQVALTEKEDRGVTLDACNECHGLWFDAHELDALTKVGGLTEWLQGAAKASPPPTCPWCHQEQTRHGALCEKCGAAVGAICPVCDVWMPAFELYGTSVDFCVRCGGVWLDAEELGTIIAEASPSTPREGTTDPGSSPAPGSSRRRPRYHAPVDPATGKPTGEPPAQMAAGRSTAADAGAEAPPQVAASAPGAPPPPRRRVGRPPSPVGAAPPDGPTGPASASAGPEDAALRGSGPARPWRPAGPGGTTARPGRPPGYHQQTYAQHAAAASAYHQPPAGYQAPAGYQQAPAYVQTGVRVLPPQPYAAAPVVSQSVYYEPYWATGPYPGYHAYGSGYWYDGYWYDPYYSVGTGLAVGLGAAATVAAVGGFCSVLDYGCGFDYW